MGRKVITLVFGVSSGLTMMQFGENGPKELSKAKIPWVAGAGDAIYWPMEWLGNYLNKAKSYDAQEEDVVAGAMWGADLVFCSGREEKKGCFPAQHYRSVPEKYLAKVTEKINPVLLYLGTGGANVAFFQPYSQIMAETERRPDILQAAQEIVPLADMMTFMLVGSDDFRPKHDQVMLQSQGLLNLKAKSAYDKIFGGNLAIKLAPWLLFESKEVIVDKLGRRIVPVTHDSVSARRVGFTKCPWVIWTGSWIGTATSLADMPNVQPTFATYEAGIAFEGVGNSRAAITNIAMLGSVYEILKDSPPKKWSYEMAAATAKDFLHKVKTFSLKEMPQDVAEAAQWVLEQNDNSHKYALAAVVITAAQACYDKIAATAQVLGMPFPKEVAIIGGWAENEAFIAALKAKGFKVRIPPLAACATHAGLAADALVRVGDAKNFREALNMVAP